MTRKSLEEFEWQTVDDVGRPTAGNEKFSNDIFSTIIVMISSFVATILFLWLAF